MKTRYVQEESGKVTGMEINCSPLEGVFIFLALRELAVSKDIESDDKELIESMLDSMERHEE